jgi:hypothetical protein
MKVNKPVQQDAEIQYSQSLSACVALLPCQKVCFFSIYPAILVDPFPSLLYFII